MPEQTASFLDSPAWHQAVETMLARAAAQGRRDGLQPRDGERALPPEIVRGHDILPAETHPLLRLALQHCYQAGRLHGAEVRRENDRRLARQEPLLDTALN